MKKSYIITLTILISLLFIGIVGSTSYLNSTKVQQALSKLFGPVFVATGDLHFTGILPQLQPRVS